MFLDGYRTVDIPWAGAMSHAGESEPFPQAWRCPPACPLRVLVVDDDALMTLVLVRQLRALGCQPVTVTSGERALETLGAEPFDVVLMDCQMPGLDGYETTRRLRRMEAQDVLAHRGRLPIIAASGQERGEAVEGCLAAGMDDYLAKPSSTTELIGVLRRACRNWPSTSDAPLARRQSVLSSMLLPPHKKLAKRPVG